MMTKESMGRWARGGAHELAQPFTRFLKQDDLNSILTTLSWFWRLSTKGPRCQTGPLWGLWQEICSIPFPSSCHSLTAVRSPWYQVETWTFSNIFPGCVSIYKFPLSLRTPVILTKETTLVQNRAIFWGIRD